MAEIGGNCPSCGATWPDGQNYCGSCGTALGVAGSGGSPDPTFPSLTGSKAATAVSARAGGSGVGAPGGVAPGPGQNAPFSLEATIGAVLLTIFMPFIALIAALILRAQELRPARREQLKTWALASGAWLATGWVIGIIIFASALSAISPSGCKGGIDQSVPPSYESNDGTHWMGTFTCMNGGTITKPVPASQVPGGG